MVDWYYIFSILLLGVYPCSPDIYNVVENYHFSSRGSQAGGGNSVMTFHGSKR